MSDTRVLVVDDDPMMLKLLASLLARDRIDSESASSAADALALMRRNQYPVVVMDIDMPGMTGIEMIPELKQINPLVQIIMVTGDPSPLKVIQSFKRGAVDLYAKGAGLSEVVRATSSALSRAERCLELIGGELRTVC